MPTYHCEVKSGRNAVDHAEYVTRKGFHSKRGDLLASGCGNLPTWADGEPTLLWKAAQKYERKNGAVYREAVIALPAELGTEQNLALAQSIIARLAPDKPYQFAIHAPESSLEGQPNPHMHLMASDREDDGIERPPERFFSRYNAKHPEKGGRKKASGGRNRLQLRDELIAMRKMVADTINHHLAINGHSTRVDHRTLKEQGVEYQAERHLGQARIRNMSAKEKAQYVHVRADIRGGAGL